jgi:predicted RNA-binding protein with PIN domain
MKIGWLIIDGYSLLHRDENFNPASGDGLLVARQRLIRELEGLADVLADRITVVFDGRESEEPAGKDVVAVVEVIFSPPEKTADTVIERMVYKSAAPDKIMVVTSDRRERETVTASGAQAMSCGQFLELCERKHAELQRKTAPKRHEPSGPTLGDFFPS